jgi:hypothetical protein
MAQPEVIKKNENEGRKLGEKSLNKHVAQFEGKS